MIQKKNCWEVMQCGCEPGGRNTDAKGVCPAAIETEYNGINDGKNAGRFCWFVAGTFCQGAVQGTFATKFGDCRQCKFLREVLIKEGDSLVFMTMAGYFYTLKQAK